MVSAFNDFLKHANRVRGNQSKLSHSTLPLDVSDVKDVLPPRRRITLGLTITVLARGLRIWRKTAA